MEEEEMKATYMCGKHTQILSYVEHKAQLWQLGDPLLICVPLFTLIAVVLVVVVAPHSTLSISCASPGLQHKWLLYPCLELGNTELVGFNPLQLPVTPNRDRRKKTLIVSQVQRRNDKYTRNATNPKGSDMSPQQSCSSWRPCNNIILRFLP